MVLLLFCSSTEVSLLQSSWAVCVSEPMMLMIVLLVSLRVLGLTLISLHVVCSCLICLKNVVLPLVNVNTLQNFCLCRPTITVDSWVSKLGRHA